MSKAQKRVAEEEEDIENEQSNDAELLFIKKIANKKSKKSVQPAKKAKINKQNQVESNSNPEFTFEYATLNSCSFCATSIPFASPRFYCCNCYTCICILCFFKLQGEYLNNMVAFSVCKKCETQFIANDDFILTSLIVHQVRRLIIVKH